MIIRGGTIVTGDGRTVIEGKSILIEDEKIVDLIPEAGLNIRTQEVFDAGGKFIIPGIINTHAHACVPGPLNPTAMLPFDIQRVYAELDRHLIGGETTVLHLCGFCLQQEVNQIKSHPVSVLVGTSHLPFSFKAAKMVDGRGLTETHLNYNAERRLEEGAVAIGEIGAGHTLGGGGQDYALIPSVIERITGIRLRPDQARELKWAVLGKNLRKDAFDITRTDQCLISMGLNERLTALDAQKIICESVLPTLSIALKGFEEAAIISAKTGYPAVLHNCPFSVPEIARLAKKYPKARLIAAHSNQADFLLEEAVDWCRQLKDLGVLVDISTWDSPAAALQADPKKFINMLREGVVDTVSTDYAGGKWEPILKGLALAVKGKDISIASAVAFATGNVARLLPEVAEEKGMIAPGKAADLVLVDAEDIGNVKDVFVSGKLVLNDGKLIYH